MSAFKDITGNKYGMLTVVERVDIGKPRAWWRCKCDCGNETITSSDMLKRGNTRSCGCLHEINRYRRHGNGGRKNRTRLYKTWSGMIQRTTNPNDKYFSNYGGRGIGICDEWRKDFVAFKEWADQNGYADDLFIDRIDNDGGYSPDNCRFVTRLQQQNNLRCNVRYMMSNGEILTNTEIANILNVSKRRVNTILRPHIVKREECDYKSGTSHLNYLDVNAAFLCELEGFDGEGV